MTETAAVATVNSKTMSVVPSSEDCSLNSASTDSTRPTLHAHKRAAMHSNPTASSAHLGSHSSSMVEENVTPGSPRGNNNMIKSNSNSNSNNAASNNAASSNNDNQNYQHAPSPRAISHRQRIPGGAAAKLMLRGPQKSASSDLSCQFSNSNSNNNNPNMVKKDTDDNDNDCDNDNDIDNDDKDDGKPIDTSEILEVLIRTKEEFENGPASNTLRAPPVTIYDTVAAGCGSTGEGEEIEVAFHCLPNEAPSFSASSVKSAMTAATAVVVEEEVEEDEDDNNMSISSINVNVNVNKNPNSLPHVLTREGSIHESASAAISAILTPNSFRSNGGGSTFGGAGGLDNGSHHQATKTCFPRNTMSPTSVGGSVASPISAFQSPKYADQNNANDNMNVSSNGMMNMSSAVSNGSMTMNMALNMAMGDDGGINRGPTSEPLISFATEEKLDKMSSKMVDPSKTLSDLLRAIASPNDKSLIDLAFMVRRKNACGALKVLTAHNRRRRQICWTVGVLPALASVLQDAGVRRPLDQVFPDVRTRTEYEEARRRAIAALTNLAMPVSNRLAVFHTPGLVQALIQIVHMEEGDCLEGACAILAYLAKSTENKILMAQVPGLFEAVLRVLTPQMNSGDTQSKQDGGYPGSPKSQDFPWAASSVSGSDESSVSTDEDRSIMSGSTNGSSDGNSSDEEHEDDELDGDEDANFTDDDDMSTDGEDSMTGSERSDNSSVMSESSGEETASEYQQRALPTKKRSSKKGKTKPTPPSNGPSRVKPKEIKLQSFYDKDNHISGARKNLFAMLGHLVKEKDNAYHLARVNELVPTIVEISKMQDSPSHVLAVQLLTHLTRHRLNSKVLVFKEQTVVPALVKATSSSSEVARRYACFAVQNFSHDKSCRQELASSEKLIVALCKRARHSKDPEERLAAICALKNLTDEPANLIPLSNTPECIATLMQIAHGQENGVTEMMQFRACDALATISHWLRKIATNGQSMNAAKHGDSRPTGMFVPSLNVVGFEQYE